MRKENNQMRINKFNICIPGVTIVTSDADSKLALKNAAFSLLLPGRVLYLSVARKLVPLLAGMLKESGLASLVEFKAQRGTDKVIYSYMYVRISRKRMCCNHVISKCIHAG